MIHIKVDLKEYNRRDVVLTLEHIGQLVERGYPSGQGWTVEGEEEKYPPEENIKQLGGQSEL